MGWIELSCSTLILSIRTQHGVYLASDSRSTNPQSDSAQKIFKFGGNGFAALCGTVTARAGLPPLDGKQTVATLDLMAMLSEIANEYDGCHDLVEYAMYRSYRTLKPFWEAYVEPYPEAFLKQKPENDLLLMIPAIRRSAAQIEVWEIRFPLGQSGQLLAPEYRQRDEPVVGWGKLPDDANSIRFPLSERGSVLSYIEKMYARAIQLYPDSVGGCIDIGYLDVGGAEWVRRKALS